MNGLFTGRLTKALIEHFYNLGGLNWTRAKLEDWNKIWWNLEYEFCILAN